MHTDCTVCIHSRTCSSAWCSIANHCSCHVLDHYAFAPQSMCCSYALRLQLPFRSVQPCSKKCCIEVVLKVATSWTGSKTFLYCHGVHSWIPSRDVPNKVHCVVSGPIVAWNNIIIAMMIWCLLKCAVRIVHD
jgi:hypothetical protein